MEFAVIRELVGVLSWGEVCALCACPNKADVVDPSPSGRAGRMSRPGTDGRRRSRASREAMSAAGTGGSPMRQYRQSPIVIAIDGGKSVTRDVADREWTAAWGEIAGACERGLTLLHPSHPRRGDLLSLAKDARLAAGLPGELQLRTA